MDAPPANASATNSKRIIVGSILKYSARPPQIPFIIRSEVDRYNRLFMIILLSHTRLFTKIPNIKPFFSKLPFSRFSHIICRKIFLKLSQYPAGLRLMTKNSLHFLVKKRCDIIADVRFAQFIDVIDRKSVV